MCAVYEFVDKIAIETFYTEHWVFQILFVIYEYETRTGRYLVVHVDKRTRAVKIWLNPQ